jgi:hypothetical protein
LSSTHGQQRISFIALRPGQYAPSGRDCEVCKHFPGSSSCQMPRGSYSLDVVVIVVKNRIVSNSTSSDLLIPFVQNAS